MPFDGFEADGQWVSTPGNVYYAYSGTLAIAGAVTTTWIRCAGMSRFTVSVSRDTVLVAPFNQALRIELVVQPMPGLRFRYDLAADELDYIDTVEATGLFARVLVTNLGAAQCNTFAYTLSLMG